MSARCAVVFVNLAACLVFGAVGCEGSVDPIDPQFVDSGLGSGMGSDAGVDSAGRLPDGGIEQAPYTVTQSVGPMGGRIEGASAQLWLDIPPGALSEEVEITVGFADEWPLALPGAPVSPIYEIQPANLMFDVPVTVGLFAFVDSPPPIRVWQLAEDESAWDAVNLLGREGQWLEVELTRTGLLGATGQVMEFPYVLIQVQEGSLQLDAVELVRTDESSRHANFLHECRLSSEVVATSECGAVLLAPAESCAEAESTTLTMTAGDYVFVSFDDVSPLREGDILMIHACSSEADYTIDLAPTATIEGSNLISCREETETEPGCTVSSLPPLPLEWLDD